MRVAIEGPHRALQGGKGPSEDHEPNVPLESQELPVPELG